MAVMAIFTQPTLQILNACLEPLHLLGERENQLDHGFGTGCVDFKNFLARDHRATRVWDNLSHSRRINHTQAE